MLLDGLEKQKLRLNKAYIKTEHQRDPQSLKQYFLILRYNFYS
jgi:hypothetical protein